MGDPDQGQLSWDNQDPSDKNVDCNEWKHWNGSEWCGRRGHVMLEWLAQEWEGENQSILRPLWPPALLAGPRPTLTLPCFPTQRSSSHRPKSRANTLQYKLQTLQLQKLKICSILLRSNKALLPSLWLIRCDVIFRRVWIVKCWMSSSQPTFLLKFTTKWMVVTD